MNSGILLINKPQDITSFDCIRRLKRLLPRGTKIGHAGTLDPFATGLLLVCIGRDATRLVPQLMQLPKTYVTSAQLGLRTDSGDYSGTPVEELTVPNDLSVEKLQAAASNLMPSYEQKPSIFSACKHQGEPLYKWARSGVLPMDELLDIVTKKAKLVHLYTCRIDNWQSPVMTVTAMVSQGTYIRVLVDDIAQQVDSGACAVTLARTAVGPFALAQAQNLDSIDSFDTIINALLTADNVSTLLDPGSNPGNT
ncbi:MAG: tRNA pseudouridine(55) synthase TruB [Candidatus Dependentiae bacterium]|jgi:tRNA pseudouridine55 synthase